MANAKPDVVEMVMPRNYVLRSIRGHAIQFERDMAIMVPRVLVEEVLAVGGAFVAKRDADEQFETAAAKTAPTEFERQEALKRTFKVLTEKNDPTDWTGSGMPSVRAVEILTGMNFTTKEVKLSYQKYIADQNAENKPE